MIPEVKTEISDFPVLSKTGKNTRVGVMSKLIKENYMAALKNELRQSLFYKRLTS